MSLVLNELSKWADKLAYWEKAALDKIVAGVPFTEETYEELITYLLEDAGLQPKISPRPVLQITKGPTSAASSNTHPVVLLEISNLRHVNALVGNQSLAFDQGLTVVFGANGSGKSGYARVLGCASFTRGDNKVLPDITQPAPTEGVASALLRIHDGESVHEFDYAIGKQCPELASFYMFDSMSVTSHLTQSNKLSFSPQGLSFLTRLAEETDQCRKRLQAKIDDRRKPHCFGALFQGATEISRLIGAINAKTDISILERYADISSSEQQRYAELEIEIAKLKSNEIPEQLLKLRRKSNDLEKLLAHLEEMGQSLSNEVVVRIHKLIEHACRLQDITKQASLDEFKSLRLMSVGSAAWLRFVEAAKDLAAIEQQTRSAYPQPDDHCLLCQQPLGAEALNLLQRLWHFLENDAQSQFDVTLAELKREGERLGLIELKCFNDQTVSNRFLHEHDVALAERIGNFVSEMHQRRDQLLHNIESLITGGGTSLPEVPSADLRSVMKHLTARVAELESKNPTEEISRLEAERLNLHHRLTLKEQLPSIIKDIEMRRWAEQAAKSSGTTKHITQMYNNLFKQVVTDRYLSTFGQILRELECPLQIKIETKSRKSEALKQIVLEKDASMRSDMAAPDKVLSEGEKRAVALADFLTEVALDEGSSGIILDDPVTSLDFEWKETVAKRLVQEALRRQVIVFTHDLHFLYLINAYSEREAMKIVSHWIRRGAVDDKPGYIFANNSPLTEKSFRKPTRAEEFLKRAELAPPAEQESLLQQGFGALRTSYEAFIIFDLFGEVVTRFGERISVERLKMVVIDQYIVEEVIEKVGLLSRYIEGHLHSDNFAAKKPSPQLLRKEIDSFLALRTKLKALKPKKPNIK